MLHNLNYTENIRIKPMTTQAYKNATKIQEFIDYYLVTKKRMGGPFKIACYKMNECATVSRVLYDMVVGNKANGTTPIFS